MGDSCDILWFDRPASEFKEAVPIGAGMIGAMVYGGAAEEKLSLNHKRLWRAKKRDYPYPQTAHRLPEIRALFLAGREKEGAELARQVLDGGDHVDPYQPVGGFHIRMAPGAVAGYRQSLNMADGLHETRFSLNGAAFRRLAFASAVDGVIVVQLVRADGPLTCELTLSRVPDPECLLSFGAEGHLLWMSGLFPEGPGFAVAARIIAPTGSCAPRGEGASAIVRNVRSLAVVLSIAVGEGRVDVLGQARSHLTTVGTDVDRLRARHVADHRALYQRCVLELGPVRSNEPTNAQRAALANSRDPALVAQVFQFGRYLTIAGSRPTDDLPTNLQGLWNEQLDPPWQSDFHLDVNLQMNYWPTEPANLSECTSPLFRLLEAMRPNGRYAAKCIYGAEGIYYPITTSAWAGCQPMAPGWDIWVGAASWLGMHYWDHWEFTADREFLSELAYPFLKECARFWETYLIEDDQGRLVAIPSQSPENTVVGNIGPVSLVVSSTMDVTLARFVFQSLLKAQQLLAQDADLAPRWQDVLKRLPPFQIGKYGQLQEWLKDYDEAEPGHRHYSHLIGMYPGDIITQEDTPEMARAARVSLERRLSHGGGHTGWSRAWTAALFARLGDGDAAYQHVVNLIAEQCSSSLLDLHPPGIFQIDGNFGATAAIAEMLLQSHGGLLRLLPALPSEWPDGKFRGLCARGGFEVDADWADGKLTAVRIRSERGGACRVKLDGEIRQVRVSPGDEWTWTA